MKEEQDLNEAEEKHQDQKAHDVTTGETSGSCSKTENGCSQSNSQITEVKKPFSCSECGNTFKQKKSLDAHVMIVHAGKRPFTCSECGNTFTRKQSLNNHVNSYGEKAFHLLSVWKEFHTGEKS